MADPGPEGGRSVQEILIDLEDRVDTLEDRVMMERLEDLSLEDEIEVVEDFLGRREEEIREKLAMLDRIEEEYSETQVEDKLQYLYQQLKMMKKRMEEMSGSGVEEEDVEELGDRISRVESRLEDAGSGSEDQNFDDVYDKLYTLRDRVSELREDVEEGVIPESEREDLVRKALRDAEIDFETVSQQEVDVLRDEVKQLRDSVESGEPDVASDLQDLEEKVDMLVQSRTAEEMERTCPWCGEEKEGLLAHVNASGSPHPEDSITQEELEAEMESAAGQWSFEDRQSTPAISAEELLEALEYEGEELEDRFKEILVRIEQISEDISVHGERMDSISHAQNLFESNIGNLIQEQRELSEKLREEDSKLERKTDLLLEAIEKGLEMEEKEFRDILQERLGGGDREIEVSRGEMHRTQVALEDRLSDEAEEGVKTLAEIASDNQRRLKELQEKVEDMEKHSPTIIE